MPARSGYHRNVDVALTSRQRDVLRQLTNFGPATPGDPPCLGAVTVRAPSVGGGHRLLGRDVSIMVKLGLLASALAAGALAVTWRPRGR